MKELGWVPFGKEVDWGHARLDHARLDRARLVIRVGPHALRVPAQWDPSEENCLLV